jgi:predicted amidohydrolase YtcJ
VLAAAGTARADAADSVEDDWLRAWGYDDALLAELRHPSRGDLDAAVPDRPVVLHHRTGHVAVLNSAALARLGLADHADGVLTDEHDLLAAVPRLGEPRLRRAMAALSRRWAGRGVSAVTDATHTNGPDDLGLLADWCGRGVLTQHVTAMVGTAHLGDVPGHGSQIGPVTIGAAKVMPTGTVTGLEQDVAVAVGYGFPAAVHVMDVDTLDIALAALLRHPPPPGTRHRIEHNALCLPEQVERISASGARVVVNPSFVTRRAAKYRRELTTVEQGWLVRIRSLVEAGVEVRAGSDSPVAPCDPAEMVRAAVHRPLGPQEVVDPHTAAGLLRPWPAIWEADERRLRSER